MVTRLLRMSEVAQRLQIGERTAYRLAAEGQLPSVHLGRSVRVAEEALEEWLRGLMNPQHEGGEDA